MKELLVMYRNNNLFSKYVPQILALLPSDISIRKVILPQGTSREEIVQKQKEIASTVSNVTYCLTDQPCEFKYNEKIRLYPMTHTFDSCMNKQVKMIYKENTFEAIFPKIAEELIPHPKEIIIVKEKICDHLWGFSNENDFRGGAKDPETFIKCITNLLSLKYLDIPIKIVDSPSEAMNCPETTLVIADRHSLNMMGTDIDFWTARSKAKLLMLPLEDSAALLHQIGSATHEFNVKEMFEKIFTWDKPLDYIEKLLKS